MESELRYEDKPIATGWYWVKNWLSSKPARIVKVFTYQSAGGKLFTSEDCGAPVDDELYNNHRWYGPLEEPGSI